jgi:xanthine dehydrogenase accessory factor
MSSPVPPDGLCVIRGGGDIATGVAWRLTRAGFPVVVTELAWPLTVRRTVALSSAVHDGVIDIEGMIGRRADDVTDALDITRTGEVAVLVSPSLPPVGAAAVVDARLAKRNLDTTCADAPVVVGLGPGFEAGVDCHAVIETNRGHHLGRVLWSGSAEANTGTPGLVAGVGAERVLRAAGSGHLRWDARIGDTVTNHQVIGRIVAAGQPERLLMAPFAGKIRGLIAE